MTIDLLIPYLGACALAGLTYILGLKKQRQESRKFEVEAESISLDTEIKLIKFYETQVIELTKKYEDLCKKLEEKIRQYEDCVQKVEDLEEKYTSALAQLNSLKNEN